MPARAFRSFSAPIPFRASFNHASAVRARAENVIVCISDGQGNAGIGEGCPRAYVTGESVDGALAYLQSRADEFLKIETLDALRAWIALHAAEIDANPSAFCAAELALLDLFARRAGKSVEALLGIEERETGIKVSAVYGVSGGLKFHVQRVLFACAGMFESKLKLSGDVGSDVQRASVLGRNGRVRLDANNLWPDVAAAEKPLAALAAHAWAVEEPIAPRDWDGMRRLAETTGLAIILDESLLSLKDMEAALHDIRLVPNLRVSKLGGLLRSLALLSATEGPVIVGAQVGETSILGRAGLALARAAGARLEAYEGAYAPLLLREDLAAPSLGFRRRGIVNAAKFHQRPGWGLGLRKIDA